MSATIDATMTMPIGVVVRRTAGVTRWAKWVWRAVAVMPGAPPANWKELRRDGEAVEYHAATPTLELHRAEAEAYLQALTAKIPSVYVVLRPTETGDFPIEVLLVTASPYEAQDYAEAGEEMVEKVPMTPALLGWIRDFVATHHEDEIFVKRQRDKRTRGPSVDGIGDHRIAQLTDVYRAPRKPEVMN